MSKLKSEAFLQFSLMTKRVITMSTFDSDIELNVIEDEEKNYLIWKSNIFSFWIMRKLMNI